MNLIASADENWGIGCKGSLLCHVPEDMRWFKNHTVGKVVVMGRATLESLPGGRGLPDRVNIVLSSNPDLSAPGCIIVPNMKNLLKVLDPYDAKDIFVIGGASVYAQLLPYCQTAYITKFHQDFPADSFLPNLDELLLWKLTHISDDNWHQGMRYNFCIYENVRPKALTCNNL